MPIPESEEIDVVLEAFELAVLSADNSQEVLDKRAHARTLLTNLVVDARIDEFKIVTDKWSYCGLAGLSFESWARKRRDELNALKEEK